MNDAVLIEVAEGVMVITLNRPERRNALDLAGAEAVARAMDELDARPDVRVGVLAGAGPTFCAGMDLKAFAATGERPISATRGPLGLLGRPPAKPLIAAVHGSVLGAGFELALACDLVVATEDAVFGLPEVTRGLVATGGGALGLTEKLPHALAMELLLTGCTLGAQRALELGLVNRLAPAAGLTEAALDLGRAVARCAPLAVVATKRIATESRTWTRTDRFVQQELVSGPVRSSADAVEGARAFAEKRTPQWQGR